MTANAHALARYAALVQECWYGSNCRTRSFNGWKSLSKRIVLIKHLKLLKYVLKNWILNKVDLKGSQF